MCRSYGTTCPASWGIKLSSMLTLRQGMLSRASKDTSMRLESRAWGGAEGARVARKIEDSRELWVWRETHWKHIEDAVWEWQGGSRDRVRQRHVQSSKQAKPQ